VERGRNVQQVLDQWMATVRPMHERYVAPCRDRADDVLDGTSDIETLVDRILTWIP